MTSAAALRRLDPRRAAGRLRSLAGRFRRDPADGWARIKLRTRMGWLRVLLRLSRRSVLGDAGVVVNVTTFGRRAATAFYALESIARGSVRPERMILWLDDPQLLADLPPSLRRLQRRGLEIMKCDDFGPHKKQHPYVTSMAVHSRPLVVADDDILYPRAWLADLVAASQRFPDVINCHRAHLVEVDADGIRPYREWAPRRGTTPGLRVFPTGVSGIIYPPQLLDALAAAGTAFLATAPRADDVWVHAVAVAERIQTRQIRDRQAEFPAVPGTQIGTLYRQNVVEGGNDEQITRTYDRDQVAALVAEPATQ